IPGEVAEAVVVGLEVIRVAERECERVPLLGMDCLQYRQIFGQCPAVVDAGQWIAARIRDQLLVEVSELRLPLREARQRPALALEQRPQALPQHQGARDERTAAEQQAHPQGELDTLRR